MKPAISGRDAHAARFITPVILENIFTTSIGLFFSYIIGGISGSALSTIALGNQALALLTAAASMLSTGSSILVARLTGAGEHTEASHVVEQTILLTVWASLTVTLACLAGASPIMRLLMPNAEDAVFAEGVAYFRVLILSLPFLLLVNALTGILRATGDGKAPLITAIMLNVSQVLFALLFLGQLKLDVAGAGLTYLCSRACGAGLIFWITLRSHHKFKVEPRNLLRPHPPTFRRILHVGIPTSVESIFVQTGYLVANSMVIGLGTFEAASYNVANTLYSFASAPQSICSIVATTMIGNLIGAREFVRAKRKGWKIWAVGMGTSIFLCLLLIAFGARLTPIYTSDAKIQQAAALLFLPSLFMCIPGISLNSLDPQLRVGGDVKYVMVVTIIAVWGLRLPLTYLLCYQFGAGAAGAIWANAISLFLRMALNMRRFIQGKYLHMRV